MITHLKNQKGFTLIEMLVSIGLFTIVMTISLGVILSIIDGNKKSQAISSVSNNLNFAIESMVRDIKTGYDYGCTSGQFRTVVDDYKALTPTSCVSTDGKTLITLISNITGIEKTVKYEYIPQSSSAPGSIKKISCTNGTCSGFNNITSPEINITDMKFYIKRPGPTQDVNNAVQSGVFLLIRGTAKINATTISNFNLQTFISQRVLDI